MNPVLGPLGLWPPRASAYAGAVDHLVWWFSAVVMLLVIPIFAAMIYFVLKYRHGRKVDRNQGEARARKGTRGAIAARHCRAPKVRNHSRRGPNGQT